MINLALQVLLLAETMDKASSILNQFHDENRAQVVHHSPRLLVFNDGSTIRTSSVGTLPTDIRVTNYDQIFVTRGIYSMFTSEAIIAYDRISSRSMVPDEFILTILDE